MVMGPAQMAGGGMPQSPAAGTQVTPGQASVGTDINKVVEALSAVVKQALYQ